MAQIPETVTFYTKADQIRFMTQTNGDEIHILNLELSQTKATSMAWLVNADESHELEIKINMAERIL